MIESSIPSANTPLYNHPLPSIEQWLQEQGCTQDQEDLHFWRVERSSWSAELRLDVEELTVCYLGAGKAGENIQRAFKYSLSRQDINDAIFSGP